MRHPGTSADWQRLLVYGLRVSGQAAARLALDRGAQVLAVDAKPLSELGLGDLLGRPGFEVVAGLEPPHLPSGIDAVVVSPGVPADRPLLREARERGLPVLAEVELAFPYLDGPVVAITGSNGKSTTTSLAAAMLQAAGWDAVACGNLGEPLAGQVLPPGAEARPRRVVVVELSSFQLEGTHAFHPRAAALLNISPDHLDRHGDLAGYAAAKRRIFARQTVDDSAVLNADDLWSAGSETAGRRRFFSRHRRVEDGCHVVGDQVLEVAPGFPSETLFTLADVPLAGGHNVENAMAAALLARALGAPAAAIAQALREFRGLPHRMEKVAEWAGVTFYDDSKGTNPGATLGTLAGLPDGSVHLILGGRNKGSDFAEMADTVAKKARQVYLIGEAAAEFRSVLAGRASLVDAGTLERAVAIAAEAARPGEIVLLSPACASFDQFRDFNHRGEVFHQLVHRTVEARRGEEARV
ncbi:MAG: UDP-N-acetylmuramoyl-L-alanine--D-glutamate ligase [Thermoanaerobaculia bacterium]|nr:UDP-N-acetylmuramoyl-L-alanine--D-glutamate ligase [Thermoanaerobaculia bacterium]